MRDTAPDTLPSRVLDIRGPLMKRDMVTRLLQFINEQHGTTFAPHGRYPTGEQGAFAISEADGDPATRLVLKWGPGTAIPDTLRRAAAITARLRTIGYPAPRYRLLG